jgi:hypothetical protein
MNLTVRFGFQPLASAMRMTSVSVATPEASSSAPGATWVVLPPPPVLIESRWAPSTTISPGSSLPLIVRMTEGWVEQVLQVLSSVLTSVRDPASVCQRERIHSAEVRPVLLV